MRRFVSLAVIVAFMMLAFSGLSDVTVFPPARATLTFGFLLLAAYLIGDGTARIGLPKITGYILAGILFGPHLLELVDEATVKDLKLIDDLALTFIALAAGGELRLKELRNRRRAILLTVLLLTTVVFLGVSTFTWFARPLIPFLQGKTTTEVIAVAAIVGTFAVARSPSSAIAIISECKARGPFTEMVLGVTVVMDVLVIIVFAVVVSVGQTLISPGASLDLDLIVMMSTEIVAALVLGVVLGILIVLYIKHVRAELLIFILSVAFLVTFGSRQVATWFVQIFGIHFKLEPMLICITAGFVVQNFSRGGALFMEKIDRGSLPIYVVFFSLTGAALNIQALRETWSIALLLVGLRAVLIWLGAYWGARLSNDPPQFRRMSGLSFITQAGVSLGLAGIVMQRFPAWGGELATMIVAVIAVNQVVGPAGFKFALGRVGETGRPLHSG